MTAKPKRPITFPEQLPICAHVRQIARGIHDNQVVIVAGETGSGKTTQLPKICLAMGRGLRGRIGCTQPRRIAATTVAARVAEEVGVALGQEVGFRIRFSDRTSPQTYIKFVTDGMLLAELQSDPMLRGYDTLIVDEAHERSLNIDFIVGYLKLLLPKRPDLRVIISSATLEIERFSSFFDKAPVIEVSGRTYPVEEVYHPAEEDVDLAERIADAVDEITEIDSRSDVLVFVPGEREIHEATEALEARALPHTVLLPLYGRLPRREQLRVFSSIPQRRVVLATNVAETSLTIPGIVFVVDSGLARIKRHNPRSGITQLLVEPISQASANQRKGRAGRVRSGVCYRLYERSDFEARPAFTTPEIQRVGLSGVILQMKTLGLGRVETFPFLDPPSKRSIREGYRVLEELGAIDEEGNPNELGRKLARLPLDPRLGRMILAGEKEKCLREITVLAAALSVQDPLTRPVGCQTKADERHRRFRDEASDFLSRLKLWQWYQSARERLTTGQLRRTCRDNFVSFQRMREWCDVHRQLSDRCREMRLSANKEPAKGDAISRALLAGLLGQVGMWQPDKRSYVGARQVRFVIHPSSCLAKKNPPWVFAAELVETSQSFARMVGVLDPVWVEAVAGSLCKRSYKHPHWEQRPAQVKASEHVTLFGLPIARDRKVHYGPIEPQHARQLFLLHALVRQEYGCKHAFVDHNQRVLSTAKELRSRARRSDMMLDEQALLAFFEARVPADVHSGKSLETWLEQADTPDGILELSLDDVLSAEPNLAPSHYPDRIVVLGNELPLRYKFEPSEQDDGVTVTMPLTVLAQVDADLLEWTIPAWHEEKILLMLKTLPKKLRKDIAPFQELASEIALEREPFEGPMLVALEQDVYALTGVRVPRRAWRLDALPTHLRFFFRVVDAEGITLGQGRDFGQLKQRFGSLSARVWAQAAKTKWNQDGLKNWSFGSLPDKVSVRVAGGVSQAYPAIVDAGSSVSLRALPTRQAADEATHRGIRRLLMLHVGGASRIERSLPTSLVLAALAARVADSPAQLRRQIANRAFDEAFGLDSQQPLPRDRKEFLRRLDAGQQKVGTVSSWWAGIVSEVGAELSAVELNVHRLTGKPGAARSALGDVRDQIESMFPPGLLEYVPRQRLTHMPRYLRGIKIRLERLVNDPRRDADKASDVVPLWKSFVESVPIMRARGVAEQDIESLRWVFEELRIRVFAPELKTALSVSPRLVQDRCRELLS